jgi:small subunit ribosomal protein S13
MADNEFREIIRLGDKDIRGNVPIGHALTKPKGSSYMFANAVCKVLDLDIKRKCGDYTVKEVEKIEDVIRNPAKYNIPTWLMNRRRDRETGEDTHILSSDLELTKQFDIRFMRKVKSYKGVRHAVGAKKVRGQSTKSTGRTGTVATRRKETK